MMTETQTIGGAKRPIARILLSGLPPALVTAAGAWLVERWRADLPNPVATHWDATGTADRFSSISGTVSLLIVFGVLFTLIGVGLALFAPHSTIARFSSATGAGTAAFATTLVTSMTYDQRGLLDASESEASLVNIAVAVAVGLLVAALSAYLIPRWAAPTELFHGDQPTIPVGADERVMWTSGASINGVSAVLGMAGVAIVPIVALLTRQWWLIAISVLIIATLVALFSIRVTVDQRGVTTRSIFGWPRFTIPLTDIVSARVIDVRPIRDFGGYGYRFALRGEASGAKGFILRSGQALLLERTGGGRDVLTIDDATTGAGVVNGLIARG